MLVEHRRVGDSGADRVDPDRRDLRGDAAHEPDHGMLRQRIDRVEGHPDEAGERCGGDDRALLHHLRKATNAEDDAVDVDRDCPPVVVVRECAQVGSGGEDAGVQTRKVDRLDTLPCSRIGDVEAGRQIERRDLEALPLEPGPHRTAQAALAPGHERLHGSSTTLPTCRRPSMSAWAAPASASGKVAPTTGSISPCAHRASNSIAHSCTSCGCSFIRRPR